VEEAFLTLSSSREQIDSAKVAIASAEESLRLARLRLQAGVGTQTEVINAETALTTVRGNLSNAVIAYNRALVQLQRAVGRL
jgi:OMF family outer membrane factor